MKHLQYNFNYPSSGNLAHREGCRLVLEKCSAQNRSSLPTIFSEDSMVFLRLYRKITYSMEQSPSWEANWFCS